VFKIGKLKVRKSILKRMQGSIGNNEGAGNRNYRKSEITQKS